MDYETKSSGSFVKVKMKYNQYEIHNPVVYTTRLDDMEIFKGNASDIRADTFINCINKESKPKLKWKRKCSQPIQYHNSFENVSRHINAFNTKAARIAEDTRLLSMCKPFNIVLEDIKYTLLRTQKTVNDNPEVIIRTNRILIYDKQNEEADMYVLDKNNAIKEYHKFRTDKSKDDFFNSLRNVKECTEVTCCCWYFREEHLKTFRIQSLETLRFMRKPHKCVINKCSCCCKTSVYPLLLTRVRRKPSNSPSMWLKKMTEIHASLPRLETSRSLLSKSLSVVYELPRKELPAKEDDSSFLNSTNIDFAGESYIIGANGQIKLHFKKTGTDQQNATSLPKSTNNILGNICCWYKREEFAGRLLALGVQPNTVNYIRSAHTCSSTICNCCCKPLNPKKTQLTFLLNSARHTNDLASKTINVNVKFPRVVTNPVYFEPVKQVYSMLTKPANRTVNINEKLPRVVTNPVYFEPAEQVCSLQTKPAKRAVNINKKLPRVVTNPVHMETVEQVCSMQTKPANRAVNINKKLPRVVTNPVHSETVTQVRSKQTKPNIDYKNDAVSFDVSLSALEILSQGKHILDIMMPENAPFDPKTSVRFVTSKTRNIVTKQSKCYIECADLNQYSTKELKMIDIIFRAINNATKSKDNSKLIKPNIVLPARRRTYGNMIIYPLSLNSQLRISTDLRNKRFSPSLKAHLSKYNLPAIKPIRECLKTEDNIEYNKQVKEKKLKTKEATCFLRQ